MKVAEHMWPELFNLTLTPQRKINQDDDDDNTWPTVPHMYYMCSFLGVLHVFHLCNTDVYHTHALYMYSMCTIYTCITCVAHMYYKCSIQLLQVYISYMGNTPKNTTCVLHMYYTHTNTLCDTFPSAWSSIVILWLCICSMLIDRELVYHKS